MILIWTGHSISSSMMEIDWIALSIPVIVDESSWFNSSGYNPAYWHEFAKVNALASPIFNGHQFGGKSPIFTMKKKLFTPSQVYLSKRISLLQSEKNSLLIEVEMSSPILPLSR